MNNVTLCEDTFDPSTWETFEDIGDIRNFLWKRFEGKWPSSAHIYLDHVAKNSDITPYDDAGVERLGKVSGHFYVVVYPQGIELILIVVAVVVAAVAVGLSFLLRPHPATQPPESSANNQLSDRQNRARPTERIPDIFGQLWATFDLLAVPYKVFIDNVEYEHCYMCIGRGIYEIASVNSILQVRDDVTPLAQVDGASANIFNPGTWPGNGSPAQTIGTPFTEDIVNLQVFTGVNGQVLKAPNLNAWLTVSFGGNSVRFVYPNIIENNAGVDWTDGFAANDSLNIGGLLPNDALAIDPAHIQPTVDLEGQYEISSVSSSQIVLDNPALINANWNALAAFAGGASTYGSDDFMANNSFWVGQSLPLNVAAGTKGFWLNYPQLTQVWANFVAPQGCYQINSSNVQVEMDVQLALGVTPCDINGNPSGVESVFNVTLYGNAFSRQACGATLKATVAPGLGGVLVRASRVTYTNLSSTVTVCDEIQWRDLYIVTDLGTVDFGNVTTIQTIIAATPSALALRERKMNALVTRILPSPSPSGSPTPTNNAADIICAMAIDPYIGNLSVAQVDISGIYSIAGAGGIIQNYFKTFPDLTLPTQFSYTYDDSKQSFEEGLAELCASIFCVAYRRGGILSISFEQKTANSTLLFNHRNKLPKSETRTVTFGTPTDNDGINLDYVEPNAPNYPNQDTPITLYFPPSATGGQTAINPKKIKTIGIRNVVQATILGWRLYWKLVYQNTTVEFECTEEAALSVLMDRILVADNTRSDTQDGEVNTQASLILTLSQDVTFISPWSYSIFLQLYDGTIESIPITAGSQPNQVILGTAPSLPLVVAQANFAKTTYSIVSNAPVRQNAFLLTEKTPKDGKIYEVKGVNYDDAYYQSDLSFTTNIDFASIFLEPIQIPARPNVDFAGLFVEVVQRVPLPAADIAGLFLETIQEVSTLPNVDVGSIFLEVMQTPIPPNVDIAGLFVEVLQATTLPNVDMASLFLETIQQPSLPNVDIASLFLEIIYH